MITLKTLYGSGQFRPVGIVRQRGHVAQVPLAQHSFCQHRHPRILHAGFEQLPLPHHRPVRQRLQAFTGVHLAQVLVAFQRRARLVKCAAYVLQARPGNCQNRGLPIRHFIAGVPDRLETRLVQTTKMQILQGLQVLKAGIDVGA